MFETAPPADPHAGAEARSRDDDWLDGLNPEQRRVALHDGGPLLVVAGAGTGKTAAVVGRLARLLGDGVPPDRILLLTFSRRAAREMLGRAGTLVGHHHARQVWGGTFHAIGHRLLRDYAAAVGLPLGFSVLDEADARDLMGAVRTDLGFGERGRRFPRKEILVDMYSRVANAQEPLSELVEDRYAWCRVDAADARAVFEGYRDRKAALGVVDFDDLLLYWRALALSEVTGPILRARFDHILVDEYQDTNVLQADILSGITPAGTGLCVVGDDAQAIYGFRAASAGNMADFGERFPRAETITLERNYRSTKPILDAANALIASAPGMLRKELWTDRAGGEPATIVTCTDDAAEAIAVCEGVLAAYERGVRLRDQAVLCRAAHHTARLEVELTQRNIPYRKYGGLRFLEAAHVKDLIALLRIADNPSDELAWRRALLLLDGVGPALTRRVLEFLALPDPNALPKLRAGAADLGLPAPALDALTELLEALDDCGSDDDTSGHQPPPAAQVDRLTALCDPLLRRRYPDASQRLADLEQLAGMASEHSTRGAFLGDLMLDPPTATSDLAGHPHIDDDWLVLSTVHSAKGLEWTNVFVVHVSDGNFPSDMALREPDGVDEERRLLYVAITRARDQLQLSFPLRYYKHRDHLDDIHFYGQPSRFLRSIEPLCTSSFIGHDDAPGAGGLMEATAGEDPVKAQLSSLWSS